MSVSEGHRPTRNPFTVVFCTGCAAESDSELVYRLRATIRRCPYGMLVNAGCVRSPLSCAAHPRTTGAMLVVQPCTFDRRPNASAHWIGPIADVADIATVCTWLEQGRWNRNDLPSRLRAGLPAAALAQRAGDARRHRLCR